MRAKPLIAFGQLPLDWLAHLVSSPRYAQLAKIRPRRAEKQRVCKLCHAEAQKKVRDVVKQEFQRLRDENQRLRQKCERMRGVVHAK
jgi:hypothetical protein